MSGDELVGALATLEAACRATQVRYVMRVTRSRRTYLE